jgi:two-component system NtrC family sensor kinase
MQNMSLFFNQNAEVALLIIICLSLIIILSSSKLLKKFILKRKEQLITEIEEHIKTQNELSETKQMLENIAQGIESGIMLLSKDYKILWANDSILKEYGYTLKNISGQYCYKVTHGSNKPCNAPNDICPAVEVIKSGKSSTTEHIHLQGKDKIFYEVSIYPLKNEVGETIQYVHLTKDITARKKLEKEKEGMYEVLMRQSKLASISELAAGLAHEIGNPLQAILGNVDLLLLNGQSPELKAVRDAAVHCKRIIGDLLNFVKQKEMVFQLEDINSIIDKALALYGKRLELSGINVVKKYMVLPKARVSATHLEEVFLNIIMNAKKAMQNGGLLEISTGVKKINEKDYVCAVFKDSGTGIKKENLEKIFGPFFTTYTDGIGLGLSVSKDLVKKHRGEISVFSEGANKGAEFMVSLPIE